MGRDVAWWLAVAADAGHGATFGRLAIHRGTEHLIFQPPSCNCTHHTGHRCLSLNQGMGDGKVLSEATICHFN